MRSVLIAFLTSSFLLGAGGCDDSDVPVGLREPAELEPANLRYGVVEVDGLDRSNGTHLLVVASGVDGQATTQLDLEAHAIRFAYDPSLTTPDAVAEALSSEGFVARVSERDLDVPPDFLPEHMRED